MNCTVSKTPHISSGERKSKKKKVLLCPEWSDYVYTLSRFASIHNRSVAQNLSTQLLRRFRSESEDDENEDRPREKAKYTESQINRMFLFSDTKCTSQLLLLGAVRRHHETKRKAYLDSLPARQEQVAMNKNKAKKKQMRSRVCIIFLCIQIRKNY